MGQATGGGVNNKRRKSEDKKEAIDAASGHSLSKGRDMGWWTEFTQRCNGFPPPLKGLDSFKSTLGISRKTFDYVHLLVKDNVMSKTGNFVFSNGVSLSIDDQVAIALRRLSTGDSLITTGDFFSVGHSMVFQLTWRFIEAMEERALHHLKWPSSEEQIQSIKSKFEKLSGLPYCCGAVDLTHIVMNLPTADPNTVPWVDEHERYSMVLQAIVDPEMRFLDIVTGWPGRMNEYMVFKSSCFDQLCENEELLGEESTLADGTSLREYIVGDSGYRLLPYLITPYHGKEVAESGMSQSNVMGLQSW
ncbi:hypothetical protein MLD38_025227 [Melastoma candidum]|uniref:Uncharacterized protein n=1 Tax=Melastoma candidum TaxID=119954 RepID=A0ACB9NWB4_9MYRT|nr:hypothetical protein MLD38_025227 [Melastoma candidum]